MIIAAYSLVLFAICTAFVIWRICKAVPIAYEDPDVVERLERIIASSKHHREQLEARADEIVMMHGYRWGTDEADDLADVVLSGVDYSEAMERIMRRKVES